MFTATYDAENRMTSIQYTDSSSVLHRQEFRYSGDDMLAEQTRFENGSLVETIRIVRDGMLAIQDRNASNAVVNEYTWGLNLGGGIEGLLNLKTAGQNYAYLYDGKGNVEAVLDAAQNVVAAYRYDPFGVLLAKTGSFEQPYGFSTKRYNAPVGMVQYEFRNYWPEIGLWDRRDPLGEAGGLNLYAFVGNNPVNWVDPWGLSSKRLPYEEISDLVVANNHSGQSNELIMCIIWKESRFDPTAVNPDPNSSATGLMQMTKTAMKDLKKIVDSTHSDMKDSVKNIEAGTHYLKLRIQRVKGNVEKGLDGYGTGTGYGSSILKCEQCLKNTQCYTDPVMHHWGCLYTLGRP